MSAMHPLKVLVALTAAAGAPYAACAQTSIPFSGKTVNIIVGFSTGGGYDSYARLLARHLGKHIPGTPTVVVQNMPGAASRRAIQYLDTTAPNDGTAIVIFNFGQITSSLVMPPGNMVLDFRRYAWIGSMSRDVSFCYVWNGAKRLSRCQTYPYCSISTRATASVPSEGFALGRGACREPYRVARKRTRRSFRAVS